MKKFAMIVLSLVMMLTFVCAAEEVAAPSITVADIVVPAETTYEEGFAVTLNVMMPESAEQVLFDEIAAFVEEQPVAEYFGEEALTAVAEMLPEVDASALVMDEFFVLMTENYDTTYGDVEVVFEFATEYQAEETLIAMVGVLPVVEETAEEAVAEEAEEVAETEEVAESEEVAETEEAAETEENGIIWIPQKATVVDGKVSVVLTQDVLDIVQAQTNRVVFALLRAEEIVAEETVEVAEEVAETAEEVVETVEEVVETVEEVVETEEKAA